MVQSNKKNFHIIKEILENIEHLIKNLRIQNYDRGLRTAVFITDKIQELLDQLSKSADSFVQRGYKVDLEDILSICASLLSAQEKKDYILLADLYELRLYPFLLELQAILVKMDGGVPVFNLQKYSENYEAVFKEEEALSGELRRARAAQRLLENGYGVEYTSCGACTLYKAIDGRVMYYHSNYNPFKEAAELAAYWYEPEKEHYMIYGLGLGYHVIALADLDETIHLDVYESDINIIQLATAFGDMKRIIEHPSITFHFDPEFKTLIQQYESVEDIVFVLHYPSLMSVSNNEMKRQLENYFLQYSAVKNQLHLLDGNFRKNNRTFCKSVDILGEEWSGKDLYIIAAGPSLDKNIMELKQVGENAIILATGTVLRKLLSLHIKPNYVIISEANSRIQWQIHDLRVSGIGLLYLSTTYFKMVEKYQGERYMICQKGYDKAEIFAEKMGLQTYETGGSVVTIALELGIRFQCKRIIFVGQDLAYTDGLRHAKNTSLREATSTEEVRMVKDISGNLVKTGKNLDIFRSWIEKRIARVKRIEFMDATEGGARIEGTQIVKLQDIVR